MKRIHGIFLTLLIIVACYVGTGYSTQLRNLFITGAVSNETARVTNGGLDINIQDQHTLSIDLRFIQSLGVTSLAVDTVIDSRTITVSDPTGFVDGTYVGVFAVAGADFMLAEQIGPPVGSVLTIDTPIDKIYASGSLILNTNFNMAVDGSVTPQVFQIGSAGSTLQIDITRLLGFMSSTSSMDDGEFGSLPALTNGCVLRLTDGVNTNLWNVKTNGDLALLGFDFNYIPSSPSGVYGARYRISYAGQSKHGVTLRLDPGEVLEFIIQDDLTGLIDYNMMGQGHLVE